MDYYVYILQSEKDNSFYIGYTDNVVRRIPEHNSGKTRYTSRKLPWKLVYTETYPDKPAAIRRERFLKAQRNRSFYEKLIKGE